MTNTLRIAVGALKCGAAHGHNTRSIRFRYRAAGPCETLLYLHIYGSLIYKH
jgi:hypothetical protein